MSTRKERRRGRRGGGDRHERRRQQHTSGGDWGCIAVPGDIETFKPEAETYHIDVIPYIAGAMNKNADVGDEYFELGYPVYNGLGIDEKRYVAIGDLLGVRDPVAEHFAKLRKDGTEWEDMKDFKPKLRQLMLMFVHEEAEKGLQLFEGAYGAFGELLDEEIQGDEEDHVDNFDDPDHGSTLIVRFKSKNIGLANPWVIAGKINFDEREDGFTADGNKKLAKEILAQAAEINLEDWLKIPDYDILQAALDGVPPSMEDEESKESEESEEPKGRRKRTSKKAEPVEEPEDDDEPENEPEVEKKSTKGKAKGKKKAPTAADLGIEKGGDVEHDEHGECTVVRVAKNGTVTIMDEEDNIHKGIDPADLEPIEGNDDGASDPEPEPEKPAATAKGGSKKGSTSAKSAPTTSHSKATKASEDDKGDEWDDDWTD